MGQKIFHESDNKYMRIALEEAYVAAEAGDVPVGAVLVENETGAILARGHNTQEIMRTAIGHAEMNVIHDGCITVSNWRLEDCTLYVTLEPCPMCAGAILHARIPRVVFGCTDPVAGALGSVWALHQHPEESKHTKIEGGCLEEDCRELLRSFFRARRD